MPAREREPAAVMAATCEPRAAASIILPPQGRPTCCGYVHMSRAVVVAAVSIVLGWAASAGLPVRAEAPSHACAVEPDPNQRLACYDRAFGAPDLSAQAEVATAKAKEEFGLGVQAKRERTPEAIPEPDVDQIDAQITVVATVGRGERIVTLDNGQQWLLVERTIRGPLRAGDAVSIRKAALGTHKLITPGGMGLRTRRVR